MAGITGDLDKLEQLARSLGGLAPKIRKAAARAVGKVAKGQYAAGQGPDGQAWPLTQDGRIALTSLTSQIKFTDTSTGIKATAPDVLQYHMEERPVFPEGGGLSAPWAQAADEAAKQVIESTLRGGL